MELAVIIAFVAAMFVLFGLSGAVSYWISMTPDDHLRKYNRGWLGPPNWAELADIEDHCRGKEGLGHIGKLARAARISTIVVGAAGVVAMLVHWV